MKKAAERWTSEDKGKEDRRAVIAAAGAISSVSK